jgi:hypothetical protein
MPATPVEPPPPDSPQPDRRHEQGAHPHAGELYGKVAIERHRKDDGRALLLYTVLPTEPK